jgi:hypothetical protein
MSIGILAPLKGNELSATDAEAVHDFLSSGESSGGGAGNGLGEVIGNTPNPTNLHVPGSALNLT